MAVPKCGQGSAQRLGEEHGRKAVSARKMCPVRGVPRGSDRTDLHRPGGAPGCAGKTQGDLRYRRRGQVPTGSLGREGQAGVIGHVPSCGSGVPGAAVPQGHWGRARLTELGLARAQGVVLCSEVVLCLEHFGFAPHPAGGAAEGGGGRVPFPGRAPGGKEGSWCWQGSASGLPQVLVPVPRALRTVGPLRVHGRVPPVAGGWLWVQGVPQETLQFLSPQPTLSQGQAGRCHAFGRAMALRGLTQTPLASPVSSPGLLVMCLCHCCYCCMGWVGFQPDTGSCPFSWGEMGGFWCPIPVTCVQHREATARGAGKSCPCLGGPRVCSSRALWAVLCRRELQLSCISPCARMDG